MDIGSLTRPVTFQQRSATRDAYGQKVTTWVDAITLRVALQASGGNEKVRSLQQSAEVTHMVTTRYHPLFANPAALSTWRIVYGTRYFNISYAVNMGERNRVMQFYVSEGLNDGS